MIDIFGIYHSASVGVKKAKLFMNGRSQAVRLPKEFRFSGSEVFIERRGEELVLRPVRPTPTLHGKPLKTLRDFDEYLAEVGPVDESFERAIHEARARDRARPPRDVSW